MADSYKDLMKKVYSYTPDEEEYAKKQGYSLNPDDSSYFAKVYGDEYDASMASAQNNYGYNNALNQQVYGSAIDAAKTNYSRDALAYQDNYKDAAIGNNSAMQQAMSAYGGNQSQLAALGLTGSGYNAQLMAQVYGGYQDANSDAYKQLQANKRLMSQVYGDKEASAYGDFTASQRSNEATLRGEQISATNNYNQQAGAAYQNIKGNYAAKQAEYKSNASSLSGYIDNGSATAKYITDLYNQDYISKDVYETELKRYQTKKAETLTAAVAGAADGTASDAAWSELDSAFKSGDILKDAYNKIYADDYQSTISGLSSLQDYTTTLNKLESEKDKLGSYYNTVKSALTAKKSEIDKAAADAKAAKEAEKSVQRGMTSNKTATESQVLQYTGKANVTIDGKNYTASKVFSGMPDTRSGVYYAAEAAAQAGKSTFTYQGKLYAGRGASIAALTEVSAGKTNTVDTDLSVKLQAYGNKTAQQVLDNINSSTSMTAREKAQRKAALYSEIAKAI